jgi:cytochrome c oxidase subunit 4
MSAVATEEAHEVTHDDHGHPSDRKYVKIAIILGVLTAMEVATYPAEDILGSALIPILMVLMVIKFWYVAAFFMHLKFDTRMFSGVFVSGLALAGAVYIGVLASFQFFL